jgi:DNA-binding CsgD family transcriptional regulator
MSKDERERLLDLIYDAAVEPVIFDEVLRRISALTNASGALLEGFSYYGEYSSFHNQFGLDPERKILHEAFYLQNPWADAMVTKPEGRIYRSDELVNISSLKKTAFYADMLKPQDKLHSAMAALANRADFIVALHFMRSEKAGAWADDELEKIRFFIPHLQRAAKLRLRLHEYSLLGQAKLDTLDLISTGVLLLDGAAKVIFANRTADRLFSRETPIVRISRDHTLAGGSSRDTDFLRQMIDATLLGGPGGVLLISDPVSEAVVSIAPIRSQTSERLLDSGMRTPKVAVFVSDTARKQLPPPSLLAHRYGLTPMETKVASELASGRPLETCSGELGIGINTFKTHARRIYNKTGTRGQADLIRMLVNLSPIMVVAAE